MATRGSTTKAQSVSKNASPNASPSISKPETKKAQPFSSHPELEGKPKCVVRIKKVPGPEGKEGKKLTIYSKLDKINIGPLTPEEWEALTSEHPPENLVVQFEYKERKKE